MKLAFTLCNPGFPRWGVKQMTYLNPPEYDIESPCIALGFYLFEITLYL